MAEHRDLDELERHEELLEKREERLQTAHQRRMEQEPSRTSGGVQGSHSVGKGFGDFFSGIAEHKGILAIIGLVIVAFIIISYVINNQNSSNNTANSSPDLAAGGYLPSDISAQLANINQEIAGLGAGTGTGTGGTGGGTGGTGGDGGGGGGTASPIPPPKGSLFTNVNSGVLHYVTPGGQTLTQIANMFGLSSWNSIYAIPENQQLLGKMSASTLRQYSPQAGINLVLPGSVTPNTSWYEVNSSTGNNTLSGISTLEGISLSRIESLNPNLPANATLSPGQEVRFA